MAWYKQLGYGETGKTKPFHGITRDVVPLFDDAHFIMISKVLLPGKK